MEYVRATSLPGPNHGIALGYGALMWLVELQTFHLSLLYQSLDLQVSAHSPSEK